MMTCDPSGQHNIKTCGPNWPNSLIMVGWGRGVENEGCGSGRGVENEGWGVENEGCGSGRGVENEGWGVGGEWRMRDVGVGGEWRMRDGGVGGEWRMRDGGVGGEWRMRDVGVETGDGNDSETVSLKKKVPQRASVNFMAWD